MTMTVLLSARSLNWSPWVAFVLMWWRDWQSLLMESLAPNKQHASSLVSNQMPFDFIFPLFQSERETGHCETSPRWFHLGQLQLTCWSCEVFSTSVIHTLFSQEGLVYAGTGNWGNNEDADFDHYHEAGTSSCLPEQISVHATDETFVRAQKHMNQLEGLTWARRPCGGLGKVVSGAANETCGAKECVTRSIRSQPWAESGCESGCSWKRELSCRIWWKKRSASRTTHLWISWCNHKSNVRVFIASVTDESPG